MVSKLLASVIQERTPGETWCLISIDWYQALRALEAVPKVENKSMEISDIDMKLDTIHPISCDKEKPCDFIELVDVGSVEQECDPISTSGRSDLMNNNSIVTFDKTGKVLLKPDLVEGNDYVAVPEDIYMTLERLFNGCGPRISRNVVCISPYSKECELEIYPVQLSIYYCNEIGDDISFGLDKTVSRYWTLSQLLKWFATKSQTPENCIRIWVHTAAAEFNSTLVDEKLNTCTVRKTHRASPVHLTSDLTDIDDLGWRLLKVPAVDDIQLSELAADYEVGGYLKLIVEIGTLAKDQPTVRISNQKSEPKRVQWKRENHRLYWRSELMVGDRIDARDSDNVWYESEIISIDTTKDSGSSSLYGISRYQILIHYRGWGAQFDTWYSNLDTTIQPLHSQSKKWRHQIAEGTYVDVCIVDNKGKRSWFPGSVSQLGYGNRSGYVLVRIKSMTNAVSENRWLDLDSELMMPLHTHTKKLACIAALRELAMPNVQIPSTISNYYKSDGVSILTGSGSGSGSGISTQSWINYDDVDIRHLSNNSYVNPLQRFGSLDHSWQMCAKAESGAVGLKNLGNTCFMNSIIQCLNSIGPITDYFVSGRYVKDINNTDNNLLGTGGNVARAYYLVMQQMWSGKYSIVEPRDLKTAISRRFVQFVGLQQQDAHVRNVIHCDVNEYVCLYYHPIPHCERTCLSLLASYPTLLCFIVSVNNK